MIATGLIVFIDSCYNLDLFEVQDLTLNTYNTTARQVQGVLSIALSSLREQWAAQQSLMDLIQNQPEHQNHWCSD